MRAEPTKEMKELMDMIRPYRDLSDPLGRKFIEGTPLEIIKAQERLEELSLEQQKWYMFGINEC